MMMRAIPFSIATALLIANLARALDPLEAVTRSMIAYVGVLLVLYLHRTINLRARRIRAGADRGREDDARP